MRRATSLAVAGILASRPSTATACPSGPTASHPIVRHASHGLAHHGCQRRSGAHGCAVRDIVAGMRCMLVGAIAMAAACGPGGKDDDDVDARAIDAQGADAAIDALEIDAPECPPPPMMAGPEVALAAPFD